jgi:hypothetical protein
MEDDGAPGTVVLAASPPAGVRLTEWAAGLPPLEDLYAELPPAPGWAAAITHLPAGAAVVAAEVSPPAGDPRAGWAGAARLDVSDVWLARIRVTGTVALWAGSFRLAGVDDPLQAAKEAWAAARRAASSPGH